MQDTKNKLHLIHKLARMGALDTLLRSLKNNKNYSMMQLLKLMVKVVRFLVTPSQAPGELSTLDKYINNVKDKSERIQFVYLSCLLELLYRSL